MPDRVIVFDVNETLLDLAGLDPPFDATFGAAQARNEWFSQLLNLAMTASLAGTYDDFSALARAALTIVAAKHHVVLRDEQVADILDQINRLSAHADARPALERLQAAGFRLAALTNSTSAVVERQLHHTGLAKFFEAILSVEGTRRFKPAPEPYRFAATHLRVATSNLRMVAVHGWDITGAMAAGCKGAFVARHGIVLNPLGPQPDVIAPTLDTVAEAIIRVDG